jgi:uncharacterized protein involved in response to NO
MNIKAGQFRPLFRGAGLAGLLFELLFIFVENS